ncbi:hypothetical protein HMPREF1337_03137, partial [Enterococcus faecalis ERV65]
MQTFRNGQKASPFYRFWKYVHTHHLTFDWIATVIKLYYQFYYSIKSLVLLAIQGFLHKEESREKSCFFLTPTATAVRKKALFHKAKVKNIPVKNFFSDVRTVSRSLFRFQAVPFA